MSINGDNKISPIIKNDLPQFVRLDHPTFIAFMEKYYEWLEEQGSYLRSPLALSTVNDIDSTFDDFIGSFKAQFLLDFPENLAINQTTGNPVDAKKLLKHIKQFYRAKGTEKTYELLFRILYDTNVEFYYPKNDILRCSDGKWILKKTIRTTVTSGSKIFHSLGQTIKQFSSSGAVTASGQVSNISRYQLGTLEIFEIEINNVNGTFLANVPVYYQDNSGNTIKEQKVYSVVSTISISNGGQKYRVGDRVVFTNASGDSGQQASAEVSQVDSTGKILKIAITNFGINYNAAPTIAVSSVKGTGFSGTATIGGLCNFDGYYQNNDGKLSSNKFLQDNHYYQNYSYVLKTEIVVDRYKEIIKRLIHPAGLGFFGQVLIKRCAEADLHKSSALVRYEVPIIGHYAPYTPRTYDDLYNWFQSGSTFAGYNPSFHDPIIITAADCNPLTNGIVYLSGTTADWQGLSGFDRADPFWIIYHHPNTRIVDPVVARIDYADKWEFAGTGGVTGWTEWTMTSQDQRNTWIDGFTSDYKYAKLQYTGTSEFRKISIRSFLTMPLGDEFDCRADPSGIVQSHGESPNF